VLVGLVGHIRTLLLGRSKQSWEAARVQISDCGRRRVVVVVERSIKPTPRQSHTSTHQRYIEGVYQTSSIILRLVPDHIRGGYSRFSTSCRRVVNWTCIIESEHSGSFSGKLFSTLIGTPCHRLSFLGLQAIVVVQAVVVPPGAIRTFSFLKLRHPFSQSNLSVKATPKGSACKGKVA